MVEELLEEVSPGVLNSKPALLPEEFNPGAKMSSHVSKTTH